MITTLEQLHEKYRDWFSPNPTIKYNLKCEKCNIGCKNSYEFMWNWRESRCMCKKCFISEKDADRYSVYSQLLDWDKNPNEAMLFHADFNLWKYFHGV